MSVQINDSIAICYSSPEEKTAADFLAHELQLRTCESFINDNAGKSIVFHLDKGFADDDSFEIIEQENKLVFTAARLRGLIFAAAQLLKKSEFDKDRFTIIDDIIGKYKPTQSIRGHQIGYRTTPNSYDAWDYETYDRYYRDLMLMGCNTVEHIPYERGVSRRNRLMKYDEEEFLVKASEMADKLDLDVSLWFPNSEDSLEEACARREKVFSSLPRLNYVFPPGGDPGELEPDELFERCAAFRKILKKYHPNAELWPSAQQPHSMPLWGEAFLEATEKYKDAIDGVITGPNRAFDLDVLRKRLSADYRIRLYPDVTHNVRCEYPVHFDRDDWHYALTTCLSRECINPRPVEYKQIHELTRGYVIGSVSYSEGINDDVNKFVWSSLDFDPSLSLRDILEDYARLYYYGCNASEIADAIFALERNWEGNPAENPHIEDTLQKWIAIGNANPHLSQHWRYNTMLFRACCDAFVRRKLLAEEKCVQKALRALNNGQIDKALALLSTDLPAECKTIRRTISALGEKLFNMIGLQLDVENYCADNPERGATLDTIDLPITDKIWLKNKIEQSAAMDPSQRAAYLKRIATRNNVARDEMYFSFALHELRGLHVKQQPDFYMNFQGDRPHINIGNLPVCMFKLYDHFSFKCKAAGFAPQTDYTLQITFKLPANEITRHHKVCVNGNTVYEGKQFGGYRNEVYEREMLPEGYAAVCYDIDKNLFINGCLEIEITEPLIGFQLSEFRIVKKDSK